jgi:hypothetical protein
MTRLSPSKFYISIAMYAALFLLLAVAAASAQSSMTIGIDAGANVSNVSSYVTGIPSDDIRMVNESGNGTGTYYGAFVDLGITPQFGVRTRFGFENRRYGNSGAGMVVGIRYNQRGEPMAIEQTLVGIEYQRTVSYYDASFLLRYNFIPSLSFTAGITAQAINGKAGQTSTLTALEDGWHFGEDLKSLSEDADITENMTSFNIALEFGVGYSIPVTRNVSVTPSISVQRFLKPVEDDQLRQKGMQIENSRLTNIRVGTSVEFQL